MNRIASVLIIATALIGLNLKAVEPTKPLTDKQAQALAASAKTPADHLQLANYYTLASAKLAAQAQNHEEMGAGYQKNPTFSSDKFKAGTINHCAYFAKSFRETAQKMKEMADMHKEMAQSLVKK